MIQNATDSPGVTARQRKLLACLIIESDISAACRTAGISRQTGHRWLKCPEFRAALERERDKLFSDALATIKSHVNTAATKLGELLATDDDRVRRLACNDIIGHALRIREIEGIERRLEQLETAFGKVGV